jgi:hypothetical protein
MSAMAWDISGGKQERRFAARRLKDLVTGRPYCPVDDMTAQAAGVKKVSRALGPA